MAEPKRPIDQLLDLVVYAPLGLMLNLEELLPQLVEKGHQQVDLARMFGKFAVDAGGKEARKRLDLVTEQVGDLVRPTAPSGRQASTTDGSKTASGQASTAATAARAATRPAARTTAPEPLPTADGARLGITDYDALSASQVVPRLAGLGAEELEAVRVYEAGNRGRKTILSKIAQLQG
jgi:hypothetical protein